MTDKKRQRERERKAIRAAKTLRKWCRSAWCAEEDCPFFQTIHGVGQCVLVKNLPQDWPKVTFTKEVLFHD